MSALSYVKNPPADANCSICLDSLSGSDKEVVAHLNDGELVHHIHKTCLLRWLVENSKCPSCRDPLDERSLLTRVEILTEKLESLLQNLKEAGETKIVQDVIIPGILTAIIGASFFASLGLLMKPISPCRSLWEEPFLIRLRTAIGPHCDTAFEMRQLEHFRKLAEKAVAAGITETEFYATFGKGIIPWSLIKELLSRPPVGQS